MQQMEKTLINTSARFVLPFMLIFSCYFVNSISLFNEASAATSEIYTNQSETNSSTKIESEKPQHNKKFNSKIEVETKSIRDKENNASGLKTQLEAKFYIPFNLQYELLFGADFTDKQEKEKERKQTHDSTSLGLRFNLDMSPKIKIDFSHNWLNGEHSSNGRELEVFVRSKIENSNLLQTKMRLKFVETLVPIEEDTESHLLKIEVAPAYRYHNFYFGNQFRLEAKSWNTRDQFANELAPFVKHERKNLEIMLRQIFLTWQTSKPQSSKVKNIAWTDSSITSLQVEYNY